MAEVTKINNNQLKQYKRQQAPKSDFDVYESRSVEAKNKKESKGPGPAVKLTLSKEAQEFLKANKK